MSEPIDRRQFLALTTASGIALGHTSEVAARPVSEKTQEPAPSPRTTTPFLTKASDFFNVSRGNPKPHSLEGEALVKARLTPESWRLEITADDPAKLERVCRLEDGTAIDLDTLKKLPRAAYLKSMQCNNIATPLGQGLWEGVLLRDVLQSVRKVTNVRRVYYWGFHNNDPKQVFQSSLSYNRVMETPPWEPPPLLAFLLNGEPIPLERGGPVRMIIPWAHGFKSIKWLQRITLTNDYKANDTYALENNDPESALKTAAYMGSAVNSYLKPRPLKIAEGMPVAVEGTAMVGVSGLQRVEYWIREGSEPKLGEDDPAWSKAVWHPCEVMPPPDHWRAILPGVTVTNNIWGFDPKTGKPKDWPLLYSTVNWTARVSPLKPGSYELRARTVDLNGFAQPEPRPYQKSGMNLVPCRIIQVTA